MVVVVLELDAEVLEQLGEVQVVRALVELEVLAVVEVLLELDGEALAQHLRGDAELLLEDAVVLLLLGGGLEALPWQRPLAEVHEDVPEGLQVVAAALLDAQVRVDGGVARGARQGLVLAVGDVAVRIEVAVLLGEAEVDDVDRGPAAAGAHEEIVGLDVAVDEGAAVDVLDAADHLQREHDDCLEGELAVAVVEQVLQGGPQEVDDHGVVLALAAEPADEGQADAAGQVPVDTGLVLQLRVARADGLQLDGDLLAGDQVRAVVDLAEGAAADLAADAELAPNT